MAKKAVAKKRSAKKRRSRKRPPRPSLSPVQVLRVLRIVTINLDEAVAFYETYVPSGQDRALIERINRSGFHPAFNTVSDALHRNIILTLCRIWDTRDDTADINSVAFAFRDPVALAALNRDGHATDAKAVKAWLKKVGAVRNSVEYRALLRARHRALAHTATPNEPYKGTARVSHYGDERKVLEQTIELVEKAGEFLHYSYVSPFVDQRRIRKEYAERFWTEVAKDA